MLLVLMYKYTRSCIYVFSHWIRFVLLLYQHSWQRAYIIWWQV